MSLARLLDSQGMRSGIYGWVHRGLRHRRSEGRQGIAPRVEKLAVRSDLDPLEFRDSGENSTPTPNLGILNPPKDRPAVRPPSTLKLHLKPFEPKSRDRRDGCPAKVTAPTLSDNDNPRAGQFRIC